MLIFVFALIGVFKRISVEIREKKRKEIYKSIQNNLKEKKNMANPIENIDLNYTSDNHYCDDDDETNVESDAVHYPKLFDTTGKPIVQQTNNALMHQLQQQPPQQSPSSQSTTKSCVLQQTTVSVHRNGHSRNPSSINGITIATQVIQPPPNKPDAIQSLLKLIRFRSDYEECDDEKSENRQICGIREARLISKWKPRCLICRRRQKRKKKKIFLC